jgi:hypothetical protein
MEKEKPKRGRPAKARDNRLVHSRLRPWKKWTPADRALPGLQDVLSGVCWLGVGDRRVAGGEKERPFAMGEMFRLLRTLPIISSAAVMEATGCKEANARKLAACLRIASTHVEGLLLAQDLEMPMPSCGGTMLPVRDLQPLAGTEEEMFYLEDWTEEQDQGGEAIDALVDEWYASDMA